MSGLSMIYAAGERPDGDFIEHVLAQADLASLGREVASGDYRLELIAGGQCFEISGISPGTPAPLPPARHFFGMVDARDSFPFEAITLVPSEGTDKASEIHQAQVMAEVAAVIVAGSRVRAACWSPAGSWMDAAYFSRVVQKWRSTGVFPALGFTALVRREAGGVVSDGLGFFLGRELQVDARLGEHATDTVRRAAKAIDHLVREGRPTEARAFRGPRDEPLILEPSPDGQTIILRRGG